MKKKISTQLVFLISILSLSMFSTLLATSKQNNNFKYQSIVDYEINNEVTFRDHSTVNLSIDQIKETQIHQKLLRTQAPNQSQDSLPSWIELGPKPIENTYNRFTWGQAPFSGRLTAIVVNASDSSNIFIGGAQGGVWKSTDNGTTWSPLTDNQSSLAIGALVLTPNQSIIYAGTGEPHWSGDSYAGTGLLKSADGGQSWTLLGVNVFNRSAISSIVLFPTDPNRILVSTTFGICCKGKGTVNANGDGIFLTTDGGTTWSKVYDSLDYAGVAELVVNSSDTKFVYAGTFNGTVYQSTDSGTTWQHILWFSSSADQGRVDISFSLASPDRIFMTFTNSTGELIRLVSYNPDNNSFFNMNFSTLPVGDYTSYEPCNGQCFYDLFLDVDPTNASFIYF